MHRWFQNIILYSKCKILLSLSIKHQTRGEYFGVRMQSKVNLIHSVEECLYEDQHISFRFESKPCIYVTQTQTTVFMSDMFTWTPKWEKIS